MSEPPAHPFAEVIILLGGAIVWALREFIPWMKGRWGRKQVRLSKEGYRGIKEMYSHLTKTRRSAGACRALVLISRNSGGVPSPGNPVKVSALYESIDDGHRALIGSLNDWSPDAQYHEVLATVANSGGEPHYWPISEMAPGMLRDRMEYDNVAGGVTFLLGHVPKGNWMCYVAFHFPEEEEEGGPFQLTSKQRDALRWGVNQMRSTLKEYHEVLV